ITPESKLYQPAVGLEDRAIATAVTDPFEIKIGAPAQLKFLADVLNPTKDFQLVSGKNYASALGVPVAVTDAVGNVVTTDNTTEITLALTQGGPTHLQGVKKVR